MDRPKGIRLRAPYATADEFVAAFHACCDETSIFVPTNKLYPTSTNCYFSLELADESPMLRGLGVVIDSWSTTENPFNQPGIRVGITQLTAQSETIFDRLLTARPTTVEKRRPRTRNAPMTQQQWGAVIAPPTQEMEIPFDRPPTEEPVRPITREMRASRPPVDEAMSPSAAPIAALDDKATETQRYDNSIRLPAAIPAGRHTTPLAIEDLLEDDAQSPTPSSFDDESRGGAWRKTSWWTAAWRNARWNKAAWWRSGAWRTALRDNRRTVTVFAFGILVGVFFTVVLRPSSEVMRDQVATAGHASRHATIAGEQPVSIDDATASAPAATRAPESPPTPKRTQIAAVAKVTTPARSTARSALAKATTSSTRATKTSSTAAPKPPASTSLAKAIAPSTTKSSTTARSTAPTTTSSALAKPVPATSLTRPAPPVKPPATLAKATKTAAKPGANVATTKAATSTKRTKRSCKALDCI